LSFFVGVAFLFNSRAEFLVCTSCVWGELYLILVSNSPNNSFREPLAECTLALSSLLFRYLDSSLSRCGSSNRLSPFNLLRLGNFRIHSCR